jgi:protein-S-isoprenylcysteine O-methyltransferase Ste14
MDSLFVVLAFYFVLVYATSLRFLLREQSLFLIYQTFFLFFQLMALALFVTRKKRISFTSRPVDYAYTLIALGSPTFFRPILGGQASLVGIALEVIGAVLVFGALLSLNTSFGIAPEYRGVKTAGMYRVVRHPMYLGYMLAETGFVLNNLSPFNGFVLIIAVSFTLLRLEAEERLLRNNPEYQAYARRTPWKLLPRLF